MNKYNLIEVDNKIVQWAHDTGLVEGATVETQSHKMLEEFCELILALNPGMTPEKVVMHITDMLIDLLNKGKLKTVEPEDAEDAVEDAIGDMKVVGTVMLAILGSSNETALNKVYEIISKRVKGGKMIEGNFYKEEDLK